MIIGSVWPGMRAGQSGHDLPDLHSYGVPASDTWGVFLREARPRALPVPGSGCFIQTRG